MFRNLRSRRRPHFSTYMCAGAVAVLLLLSVALLYSRLTFSRHSFHHHHQTLLSDEVDSITNDRLLDDPDFATKSDNAGDDRIDELDVVDEDTDQGKVSEEEDALKGVDVEEDDSDQTRVSGFYFDHAIGVIRRASDKRSIDQWEDYAGFDMGLGDEYKSKDVFGSDDVSVDEYVRRKAGEVTGMEDVLMLKTGKRDSPLREGWGKWFDAKSDFLRKDMMFNSHLELLNPLNNPMLQDPDGVGVTRLTIGDKLVQRGLLEELKKVPFSTKKPLEILETNRELKNVIVGDEEVRSEIKRAERRTLDDSTKLDSKNIIKTVEASESNKKDIKIVGSVRELKNLESDSQVNSEFSGHLYANGKRWGYFPGLQPHLSFSSFMNAFFRKGKCSTRFFMVWNSPPWMYSVRHQRGLESLFLHHRDACVVVFSETIELDFFKAFAKDGFKIAVAMPNLDDLLKNTPTHVFASVWFEWRKTSFYSTHYSELVRLAALYKYGGIYLDSDIILLKPLSALINSVGLEDQPVGSLLNGAVMAFRKHSPFIMECLTEFFSTYDDSLLRWNGADLLIRAAKTFQSNPNKDMELKVQPSFVFFPIGPQNITRYFIAPATKTEKTEQDALFKKILDQSLTFHFWNSLTSSLVPEPDSLVARFINHSCIRCSDVL